MKIKLYNTLHHKIEEFKPINDRQVGMYTCGPTVYHYPHIGNFSSYIRADILKRVLYYFGYKVNHVMNITDVGHLTSDGDTGEDKLEKGAKREGKTARQIAKFYEKNFKSQLPKYNIIKPDIFCRATDHIKEQVMMVVLLEKKGYTYRTCDGIYFDTSKIKNYGELANIKGQDQIEGARVEINPEKKNPQDFAVWKFEPKGVRRQMVWATPWGKRTFPGWHLECSAMGIKYLGDRFDIHTGGIDLASVHHVNEIAQNEAATGHKVVNYWVHSEHLLMNNHKMSKSSGGFITTETFEDKGFEPLAFRYLVLTANYRHKLNFTWKSLESAQESLKSLRSHIRAIRSTKRGKILTSYKDEFEKALAQNIDTSRALAVLWKMVKSDERPQDIYKTVIDFDRVLGLKLNKISRISVPINVRDMVKKMDKARNDKNWKIADQIRDDIQKLGYKIRNTDKGSIVEK